MLIGTRASASLRLSSTAHIYVKSSGRSSGKTLVFGPVRSTANRKGFKGGGTSRRPSDRKTVAERAKLLELPVVFDRGGYSITPR